MTYVQWYWPDDDLWCYDELDDERWSMRHIEVRAQDRTFVAAASLTEALEASDAGDPSAIRAYERRYGIVPEASFPTATADDQPPIEPIAAETFERLWQRGRQAREMHHGHPRQ